MSAKNMKGLIRLVAAITASVVLLPFVISLYLAVSPNATAHELWMAFVQAVPFGESIATMVVSLWEETQSGADSLVDWLFAPNIRFSQYFSMEMAEIIFTSVVILLFYNVIGKRIFKDTSGGMLNHAANAVFQVFLTFCASLVVDWVFDLFAVALPNISGIAHDIWVYIYSGGLGIVSIVMLAVSGIVFLDTIILVGIGCLKIALSYSMFLWLLVNEMHGGSVWGMTAGIIFWLAALWLLQICEDLFVVKT